MDRDKKMKRARSRERRYWQLLQQLPAAALVLVHDRIRFANQAAATLLGAKSIARLRDVSYRSLVLSANAVQGGGEHQKLRRMDGTVIDVEAIYSGPPSFRRVVLRDLSRFLNAERDLRSAEERFRLMSENVRDRATITLNALGDVAHWNEAAERLTGLTDVEIIGEPFGTLFAPDQKEAGADEALLRRAISNGRAEVETWMQRADGAQYYAAVSVVALLDRERKISGFAVMLRDFTLGNAVSQQLSEEQVRQAQRMEAVGRLASGVAHDFNNLLTAIHGHAQFLLEDLSPDNPSRADAQDILNSAERAAGLTRQLLAFSKGQSVQPRSINLNQTVTSIEKLLRRVISENITLKTNLADNLAPMCADPNQIEQVLVNLVVNARDAMPHGGAVTIKTANAELAQTYAQKHEQVAPGEYVMLAVSDEGVGMSTETQQRIFEPFFTTKEVGKGTGLGLSTVYGIVREAGGHIFVYSEPGHGTVFKIYFPATRNGAQTPLKPVTRSRTLATETVLVVEDDPGVRTLAKRVLESRGYKVLIASNGHDALSYVQTWKSQIDLVIVDLVLPDTSGATLVDKIEAICAKCRVIMMSGYTADEVHRHNVSAAQHLFVEKPFTPEVFAQKVREALQQAS